MFCLINIFRQRGAHEIRQYYWYSSLRLFKSAWRYFNFASKKTTADQETLYLEEPLLLCTLVLFIIFFYVK